VPYNLTSIVAGNDTGLLTFTQGVNTELMSGLLGAMFLVGVCVVFFTSFILTTNDVGKSGSATAFIAFTLALSLTALDLLSPLGLFITLIATGALVAITWNR